MAEGRDLTGERDTDLVPATSVQQRMWFAERMEPGSGQYNVPFAWRVRDGLDAGRLTAALAGVVDRHEILRTSFVDRDGRLHQRVGDPWVPELERLDLRGVADGEERLSAWLDDESRRGFDLATDRLLRAGLVDLDGGQVFFLCVHHLVWDGSSMPVFLRDLRAAYEAADPSEAAPLGEGEYPPSTHQERMAFTDRFEKGLVYEHAPTYLNVPLVLRLPAVPDRATLDARLSTVVARHEALRTSLVFVDDVVRQRVHPDRAPRADWLAAGDSLQDWLRAPFDLEHDSLFRVAVQQAADGSALLALAGHQAVVDRASLAVVAGELVDGTEGGPTSYRRWLADLDPGVVAADLAVQEGLLRGEIEPIVLPEREPRAAVHVYAERSAPVTLPAGLDTAAARLGVGVDALLLAAFHAVLAAYSGQYDVVLGTVRSRRGPGHVRVVGPLANLVPVRLSAVPDQDFRSLAALAAEGLSVADRHPHAPFDDLVRVLDPAKDMSRTPLFDVLFDYSVAQPDVVDVCGGYGKYDLQLLLHPDGTGASGRIVYNGLYFDDDQLASFVRHLVRVLDQAVTDPGTTVAGFELLSEAERRVQLSEWNETAAYPDTTMYGLLRETADAYPDRVALTADGEHRTYRELMAGAERIGRALAARGVGPGELVALLLGRGIAQVEAILGVLAAGAAYLPIVPTNPDERIAFIIEDSETRWVIADREVPTDTATALSLPELTAGDHDVVLPRATPEDLVYCIYTSGTTGKPKGALITNRNLVRLVRNDGFPFDFGADDVWTLFHSYSFDFSVWEIFACFAHGGRLVVVADDVATDPRRFLDLLHRERVTVLNQTPTAFGQLTRLVLADGEPAPADLRYVLFSGEALAPGKLADWVRRLPDVRLVNMYGITETTVLTTTHVLRQADIDGDVGNIGRAMPTNATYLLDRHNPRRLLPVGAIGEIYVGGEGVAVGYLKRPELNAERFLPDPFTGGRMFRSGDLARYLPDGTLEYLGRGDFQIKLRGFRIEPGEIESCLRAHPDVADAVVLLDGGSEGRLVAYLRCPGGAPDPTVLRAHLGGRLPVYMVPAEFHLVDEFARTGNGKLDRRALRDQGVALSGGPRRTPHTPTGRLVASIYERLLPGTTPGADDSFFELGGHSILATRLVGELAAATGVRLSLRDLFLLPAVQDLADHVDSLSPGGVATVAPAAAVPVDTEPLLWRIRGELSAEALRAALGEGVDMRDLDADRPTTTIDELAAAPGEAATVLRSGPDEHLVLVPARHSGADLADGLDHWADHLAGAPAALELCPPPSRPGQDGSVRVALPVDVAARTDELRADCRASWSMLAVAAVSAMLHRWSGSDDVTFGLPVAAHANLVVLRSRHKHGMSFADLLADVRESMLDAQEFGAVPLPAVLDHLGTQPFRDVVVDAEPDGEPFGPATITVAPARAPGLTVTVTDADVVLSYRGDRYAEADVRRMGDWLARLLHDVGPVADEPLESVLPAAGARQYRDFALAQTSRAEGEAGLAHWAHALAGAPAYPAVPTPRRATPPGEVAIELADDTLPRLRDAMRAEHGVSWFMVAATGLAALLHRWTGQADVTFGSPVANRQEFADVLGPCLNTVVLRSECTEETSVRDLLYAMRDRVLAAFDHQWVPFDEIVHRLNPPRRAGWTPYLDVLLAVFTEDAPEAVLDGIELTPMALDHYGTVESGMFGLSVGLEEVDGRLAGAVRYRGDRYTEDDVRLMARWLGRFLESFADVAGRPVHTLDLVDDSELAALTRFEQGPPAGEPTSVPALVARHCAERPDAVAVRSGRGVLTYSELAARSASLAGVLRGHATGDTPVAALVLPRGVDLVVAMLGAWQAGLAVSLLDPACPATRIRSVVDELGASVVVAADPSIVDGMPVVAAGAAGPPVAGPVDPDATACVLYTAGTTGEPKPVAQRHSALARACGAGPVERSDRVSWLHPVASVQTQLDVWRALAAGAELVPYDGVDPTPDQAPEVAGWLAAHDVTVAAAPTSLAEALWAAEPELPALRWLVTGGATLTSEPPTRYRVCTTYACADALEVTRHELTADSPLAAVGRPAPGARVAVLDAAGNRCPIGIPGEIHVDGATGDRGRWLPNGTLEYLGRLADPARPDYRAVLAIESYLRDDPRVAQAVVQHFPDEAVPLVAYAVAREGADTRATLARLRLALPAALVPGELMWLDRLPVNRRGKIDLGALPRPARNDGAGGGAPAAGMEQRIAAVWCAVLGLDAVGAHDNFFDLGGNSLLLARLHARLQAALGTALPIRRLFEHPTVHLLARALTAGPASAGESGASRDRGSQTRAALANRARPTR